MQRYIYSLATDQRKGFAASVLKSLLWGLSVIYGLVIRALIRINRFSAVGLGAKVISVGNITLGGTGKTSLVEFICRYLKKNGRNVSVLSRGYKRRGGSIGDEPYMLQANLKGVPVIVNADRIKSGNKAINDLGADTLVLDDGFQQWKLRKGLEIVTIDAANPFGNKHLIPRGILREPLSSLKRADVFVLTKTNLAPPTKPLLDFLSNVNPSAEVFEALHNPESFYSFNDRQNLLNIDKLRGRTVGLFCGIGDPVSFERLIAGMGIKTGLTLVFPDHHNYTQNELDEIFRKSREKNIVAIITTEKDASRLYAAGLSTHGAELLVLRVEMSIKNEQGFYNRLLKLYSV